MVLCETPRAAANRPGTSRWRRGRNDRRALPSSHGGLAEPQRGPLTRDQLQILLTETLLHFVSNTLPAIETIPTPATHQADESPA